MDALRQRFAQRAADRAHPPELAAVRAWYESECDTGTCGSCATCRPEQRTPPGDWDYWLYLAGRGAGKTRSAAEDAGGYAVRHPFARQAILAPTFADARDICVEGESGLLSVFERYGWEDNREYQWNRSMGEVKLVNGGRFKLFTAEKPARLRGPQHHRAWVDELAQVVLHASDAWDMLELGLRLGARPQIVATTTPLPLQVIRDLLADPTCAVTRGKTLDNRKNLAPSALRKFEKKYRGTRLGRQELDGELLEDIPGALWKRTWLDDHRLDELPDWVHAVGADGEASSLEVPFHLVRVVVAVDPAVTSGEDADETGIIVAGLGNDGRYYVLADASVRETPGKWVRTILDTYDEWFANEVVIETNQGGDALVDLIRSSERALITRGDRPDRPVPIRKIHAKRGKRVRAEEASALYEQGRVSHVGPHLTVVEDQMCVWLPESVESPDRMDALVYALLRLSHSGGGAQVQRARTGAIQRHVGVGAGVLGPSPMTMTRR